MMYICFFHLTWEICGVFAKCQLAAAFLPLIFLVFQIQLLESTKLSIRKPVVCAAIETKILSL